MAKKDYYDVLGISRNTDPAQIRQATYDVFAVETGKKFHEYERAIN